jgi:hypothetical protein
MAERLLDAQTRLNAVGPVDISNHTSVQVRAYVNSSGGTSAFTSAMCGNMANSPRIKNIYKSRTWMQKIPLLHALYHP